MHAILLLLFVFCGYIAVAVLQGVLGFQLNAINEVGIVIVLVGAYIADLIASSARGIKKALLNNRGE